jgi:prepilin-type N-terminal cleavage/methylation domain-containing protein
VRTSAPRAGNTLIELLVVLVVLGVLLTVVNVASMSSGARAQPMDRLRHDAIMQRTALIAVDSSRSPRVFRRAEPTGLSLTDSAGLVTIGARK